MQEELSVENLGQVSGGWEIIGSGEDAFVCLTDAEKEKLMDGERTKPDPLYGGNMLASYSLRLRPAENVAVPEYLSGSKAYRLVRFSMGAGEINETDSRGARAELNLAFPRG